MMQKKDKTIIRTILYKLTLLLAATTTQAAEPMWTFTPLTPTTMQIKKSDTLTIQYVIQNKSLRPKQLKMLPQQGVTANGNCTLAPRNQPGSSCVMNFTIMGGNIPKHGIKRGPALCQSNPDGTPNPNQCYQPAPANILNISLLDVILSPNVSTLVLSINDASADPSLIGNSRQILIQNTGTTTATGMQVDTSGFPVGTIITSNTCTNILPAGQTCIINIKPGTNASVTAGNIACNTPPGFAPIPGTVTVSATNVPPSIINVLVLGYGCIYQGGYLFSVDDTTSSTRSIGGKVAALTDQSTGVAWDADPNCPPCTQQTNAWDLFIGSNLPQVLGSTNPGNSGTNGPGNTWLISNILNGNNGNSNVNPATYAAGVCISYGGSGYTDWYLPAICELGRYVGVGDDAGCGTSNSNLFISLFMSGLGSFTGDFYWSSTEATPPYQEKAWQQRFSSGLQGENFKDVGFGAIRCVRQITS